MSEGSVTRASAVNNQLRELILDILILVLTYLVILSLLAWGDFL